MGFDRRFSYGCPVCNGMQTLTPPCPRCSRTMLDAGPADDYTGPYSPYRPADDWRLVSGAAAPPAAGVCTHQLYCPACGTSATTDVAECPM